VLSQLPTGISQPSVLRFDINEPSGMRLLLLKGDMDERDLYDLAFNIIEPQIEHIDGVAFSNCFQAEEFGKFIVTLDRNRIQAMNIPVQTVLTLLANSNLIIPSGTLRTGPFDYTLKTKVSLMSLSRWKILSWKQSMVFPCDWKDIGSVEDSYQEQTEIVRVNGKPGVIMRVLKLSSANTVQVVDNVVRGIPKVNRYSSQ